jgi:hypothetical protein
MDQMDQMDQMDLVQANYDGTKLKDYGTETVLAFIRTHIKHANDPIADIIEKIKYVTDAVPMSQGGADVTAAAAAVEKEDMSSQGFYYERLWDLCVKFGVTNLTLPAMNGALQTSHVVNDNPNMVGIEFKTNCWSGNVLNEYLQQKVRSGSSGGYSDVTFLNKFKLQDEGDKSEFEELYFISVKYFQHEKEIGEYDIGKLCSLIEHHKKANRTIKVCIFLKDKAAAIAKFEKQRMSSGVLMKYINPGGKYENVYDSGDLRAAYFKLKKLLEQFNYLETHPDIENFEKTYLRVLRRPFIPRFHQELFILKINKLMDDGKKNILVGAIPRSGKSYIMAGTILEHVKRTEAAHPGKKLKFLMMTPAPNETFGEYKDIFANHIDFLHLGIDVIEYKGDVALSDVCVDKTRHCVIIISKQKLGWSAGSKAESLLESVEDEVEVEDEDKEDEGVDVVKIKQRIRALLGERPDINVMFLDEAHFGMSTEKAQKIVEALNSAIENTVKIYVTATYNKPLQAYGVESACTLTWDMNDIKIMKTLSAATINDNPVKAQFGTQIYESTLAFFGDKSGESLIEKLKSEYAVYPKPYLITSVWDKEFLNAEKLKIGDTEFGWDMNKLFTTNGDQFVNAEQMKELMRYYFGYPDKREGYDKQSFYRTRGILPRIRNICLNRCRTLQPNHKTTQLWFLPLGTGKIKDKVKALINLLVNSNEFVDIKRSYHFFVAVDMNDKTKKGRTVNGVTYMGNPHNIKQDIEAVEKEIADGKIEADNLIILAGQRLQLGISLRNVDIVTLWNSISSADAIFQIMFRSMTEVVAPPCKGEGEGEGEGAAEYCPAKSFGFMVDMNPQRALTNVSLFNTNVRKMAADKADVQQYRQITDLINIDEDVLRDKYGESEEEKNKFVTDLFNKLYASWNVNTANVQKIISKLSFDMAKLEALRSVFEKIRMDEKQTGKEVIDGKDADEVFEKSGKKKPKKGKKDKGADGEEAEEQSKEINLTETATELISEFISLLNIFTLYAPETGAKCILTDDSNANAQIAVVDDIVALKRTIYADAAQKDMFLKILNGRLTGDSSTPYSEQAIDGVLGAIHVAMDMHTINKIVMAQKKHYYTIHEPAELLNFINRELTPKEKEKKENGEVFTPITVVEDMLTNLDEAYMKKHGGKSIFAEQHFKWLDPAVGIGNFPIVVYRLLMKGLAHAMPDEEKRRKHILEHMLYASELTPKNVFIYKKIFCGDTYKLNIHEGDTLQMNPHAVWGIDRFDVIIGNPPYNKGGIRSHTGKQLGDKNETIWTKFIEKSFDWLKSDGFLVFINPLSWLKKSHSLHNMMLEKHIVWLKLWDDSQSKSVINADIPISLYVLQNTLNTRNEKTEIISEIKRKKLTTSSHEFLNKNYSIPLAFHSIFDKLNRYIETQNCELDYKTTTVKSVGTKEKIPKKYELKDMLAVDTYAFGEIWVKKAIEHHPDASKRKLIIANKRGFKGAFIDDGKLSLTGTEKIYVLGENLELILKILRFDISNILCDYTKYRMSFLEKEVCNYIPDIRKLGIADITEDDFYKKIGFTQKEIQQIKNQPSNEALDAAADEEPHDDDDDANEEDAAAALAKRPTKKTNTRKLQPQLEPGAAAAAYQDKILNPFTNRWVINNPANQKKIGKLTLKKGGRKNKSFKQKHSKTKKHT